MEPHHHCMSLVLLKWTGSWFLMRIMESPINTTVKKLLQRVVLKWVLILDELWITEVTLLKCGYWFKVSNIWNRVIERDIERSVCGGKLRKRRNKEDKRWRKCGWEKTEETRNKKGCCVGYDSLKSLCWSVGTGLRQAIFETELEIGIERSLWRKIEKREK